MPDIDSLTINITASSSKAVTAINNIVTSLKGLNDALSNPQQLSGAEKLGKSLDSISKAVNSIDSVKIKNLATVFSSLATSGNKLSKTGVAKSLTVLGNETAKASKSTEKFGFATAVLANSLDNLHGPTKRARHHFASFAAIVGHLYANFFLLIRGAQLLGKAMDYSSSMTEAANVVSVAFGSQSEKMNEFADTAIKDFGLAKLSATEFASRFQAMGKTMGITTDQIIAANSYIEKKISGNKNAYEELGDSVADMSINLTKLTADMASLYNQDYADVAQDMQAIFTGMTRPLRKYGLDLTNATLKEWAMSQGLDSNIEKMSQAEKTMLRYQYVMSRTSGVMGDFKKTADTWANAMRTVKQLLQEIARLIGEALINALRPALLAFRDFLFNFLEMTQNALNALGKLLGWEQINFGAASLVDDTEDYADALDDAAGAAKKLKGQLRGIDELNNLTTNDKGGSGAGGIAGVGADLESMLDEIGEEDKPYESAIESWYEFGQKISEAFKNGLDSIDWEKMYERAAKFGVNLGSFLNGLFQVDTFKSLGATIAKGLNTAFKFAFEFGKQLDTREIGASIGGMITQFFEDFDFKQAAETLNTWAKNFWDFLTGLFKGDAKNGEGGLDKSVIIKGISEFFNNLDVESWRAVLVAAGISIGSKVISMLFKGFLTAIKKELAEKLTDPKFFSKLLAKGKFVTAIILGLIGAESLVTGIGEAISTAFGNDELAKGFEKANIGKNLLKLLGADFEGANSTDNYKWSGVDKIIEWANKTKDAFDSLGQAIKNPFDLLYNSQFDESHSGWQLLELPDEVQGGWLNLKNSIEKTKTEMDGCTLSAKGLTPVLSSLFTKLGEKVSDLPEKFEDIKKVIDELGTKIKAFWDEKIVKFIDETVKPYFTKEKWDEILGGISTAFKSVFSNAQTFGKNFFNKLAEYAESFINGVIDGFGKIAEIKAFLTGGENTFSVKHISIPRFANGGYPQVGSLFLAGEAGSEMVGSINGKTGVVSNGEITGIADAIRSTSDTEIQLLRQQNVLLQGILEKEFGISKDSLFRSVRESAREYSNMTGRPAFT